jgi:hypothetical protein
MKHLQNIIGDITLDSREINLIEYKNISFEKKTKKNKKTTFISTFELSPVHCLNPWP